MPLSVVAPAQGAPAEALDARSVRATGALLAEPGIPARDETDPVAHSGDSADDPAIWRAPDDPSLSLVIGTDKNGALETYDLEGNRIQSIPGTYPDNVDLRGNLVATSDDESGFMRFYRIAPSTRQLRPIGTVAIPAAKLEYGLCLYRSSAGPLYAFVNLAGAVVQQWRLDLQPNDVTGTVVRSFDVGSRVEGCAADDVRGGFYISEQDVGVWRYGAEPDQGTSRVLVDSVAPSGNLVAEVEGITIAGDMVIVSSQGDSHFSVYGRAQNQFRGRFSVVAGPGADGCSDTDGIDARTGNLGPAYPDGLFVCQDGSNSAPGAAGNQSFKYVDLADITAPF
jgi:3-phytase